MRHSLPRVSTRWGLVLLAAAAASCADPTASRQLSLEASLNETAAEPEVIINDIVWPDPTVQHEPYAEIPAWEPEAGALTPSFSVAAAAAADPPPEPVVRVGIFYAEFSPVVTSIRLGGESAADVFELRRGIATGPLIASGLTGEVVARLTGTPGARTITLDFPNGTSLAPTTDPIVLISASGVVRIRRTTTDPALYRGTAEVRLNPARTILMGVNELPIEQYIRGVVPRELGPIAFPEVEALKAQSVTARTYARRRLQFCPVSRCSNGYHLIPTTGDQVYGGKTAEHPVSSAAVDATRGVVATFNGGLIDALYSSTSGGWTANSEDVFANPFAYLRGVPDHERGAALEHVPSLDVFKRHANPTNLRAAAEGDFESNWASQHRWYLHWSEEEMRQAVGRIAPLPPGKTFDDPGAIYSITITKRADQGRALEIVFDTEKRGTLIRTKDGIRSALRFVTYNAAGAMVFNSLRSTLVYLEPEIDPRTKQRIGWEAWGGGFGHGVGMSQTGAVGMAEKGHTYEEIIRHYYQGVAVEKRW